MWRVIRTPLVSFCSRISECSAQSVSVTGSHVNVIKMFCRFSKESHSTVHNAEPRSKWQVQWKLRIWEACEQRCARHHAVCWWPSGQGGYMPSEWTVACCIISCLLFSTDSFWQNCIWSYKRNRGYYILKIPIIVAFWFLCYIVRFVSSKIL